MGSEWITLSLQDLGRIITGKTPSTKDSENFGGDIPFVSPRDLDGDRYIDNTERTLTLKGAESVKNSIVPERSVLVSCIGSDMGKAAINRRECVTNQQINSIIVSNNFDAKFVYYNLSTRKDEIRGLAGGSAQPILNKGDFGRLEITLPESISEQRDISRFLGFLDDKIELNRQINTTLESMAQALFKSWFVDFDPVIDNALAAGNEIPDALQKRAAARAARREALRQQTNETTNKTTGATDAASSEQALPETGLSDQRLPPEIQQLFPDRFVLTEEMGWVPEGWEVALSGDLIDVRDGTHDSPKKSEVGYPLVTSKHITSGRLELANTYLISEKDYDDVNKRSKVETGDILLTMIGTVGIPYLVMEEKINFAIKNIGLFRTSASPEFKYYFFLLLGTHGMQTYLDARMAGTTQKYLSLKVLRNLELIKPARNVLQVFNSIVDSWFQRKTQTEKSSATLADLRDSLLPKLLSGQITIPDAEQQLAEVL